MQVYVRNIVAASGASAPKKNLLLQPKVGLGAFQDYFRKNHVGI